MQNKSLVTPLVHLNGTGKDQLMEQYTEAGQAIFKAIQALHGASPNQRDYYPLGNDAWVLAKEQHQNRIDKLVDINADLMAIIDRIDEQ